MSHASVSFATNIRNPAQIYFVVGAVSALYGLGLWIVYYVFRGLPYPGTLHASAQILCFFLSVTIGILESYNARAKLAPPQSQIESVVIAAGIIIAGAAFAVAPLFAYAVSTVIVLRSLARALRLSAVDTAERRCTWILVYAGLSSLLYGLGVVALVETGVIVQRWLFWQRIAFGFMYVAAPALALPGLYGLLFSPENSPKSNPKGATLAAGVGASVFVALTAVEALYLSGDSEFSRATIHSFYFLRGASYYLALGAVFPLFQLPEARTTVGWSLWLATVGGGLAFLFQGAVPEYHIAWEHWFFIGSVFWLALMLVTQSLYKHIPTLRRKTVIWVGLWVVFALTTRVSTDMWTGMRLMHLAIASLFLFISAWVWIRGVRSSSDD